jgi:hypothetical protein
VYSRELDGRVLTLVPSGWTYKNTFVLYDRETETLWYPYRRGLMGIQGQYFKRWLPTLSSEDTIWQKWKADYPETKVLE